MNEETFFCFVGLSFRASGSASFSSVPATSANHHGHYLLPPLHSRPPLPNHPYPPTPPPSLFLPRGNYVPARLRKARTCSSRRRKFSTTSRTSLTGATGSGSSVGTAWERRRS